MGGRTDDYDGPRRGNYCWPAAEGAGSTSTSSRIKCCTGARTSLWCTTGCLFPLPQAPHIAALLISFLSTTCTMMLPRFAALVDTYRTRLLVTGFALLRPGCTRESFICGMSQGQGLSVRILLDPDCMKTSIRSAQNTSRPNASAVSDLRRPPSPKSCGSYLDKFLTFP